MSKSLRPHRLQHARLVCPSLSPRVCSNSCPLSWWCHLTISSSVASLSSCPQYFPASGSFLIIRLFESGSQSIGASASVLPVNIQGWFAFSSVQSLSHVRLFATPWIAALPASLSITNSRSSPRLTSIESVMPSSHLILCRPLLLLPLIPPSIRVFSNESTLRIRWPKYWSFSFSIIPSKEIPGLIFRLDWLDLLAVQGTLKSLLQHHSSKPSILQRSAFFIVQLSHPYMTTGKTIALTEWSRSVVSDSVRPHRRQPTRLPRP